MRTADLIHLLRSRERNSSQAKTELASLHPTRLRHLLGETSNWLRAEIQKYQDRQQRPQGGLNSGRGGGVGAETEHQAEIRAQIKKTLQAIQQILDCDNHGQQQPQQQQMDSIPAVQGRSNGSRPRSDTGGSANPQELALSDRAEERILDSLLTAILIGIMPLGGLQRDSTDVQYMSAKILYYCLCPPTAPSSLGSHGNTNPLFVPAQVAKRMMDLTRKSRNQPLRVDKDRNSVGSGSSRPSSDQKVDAIEGLATLLQSPLIKLRDYGLRIIASHRILISYDECWILLAPISSIVQSLVTNLEGISATSHATTTSSAYTADGSNGESTNGIVGQELENEIGVHFKALVLLQCFLQEAGKHIGGPSQSTTSSSSFRVGSTKWKQLQSASSVALIFSLWREIQLISIVYKVDFKGRDKIVLQSMAVVYWILWVFQEESAAYIAAEGADTLMAWYGYFIVSRDLSQASLGAASEDHGILSDHPVQKAPLIEDDIKHQSAVLEYLSKIIQTIVTSKKHHVTLFSGKRPVGIIVIRRTIEFLENILDSTLPVTTDLEAPSPYNTESPSEEIPRHLSFSVRIIQQKPGILESMLAILLGCFKVTREGDDLILHTGLSNLLILTLSGIQSLFGVHSVSTTVDFRIQLLTLNLLLQIMKRDLVPRLEDIPKNHWDIAYPALVDRIMGPLENETETILLGSIEESPGRANLDPKMTQEQDIGIKALRLFLLLWRHKPRSRSDLSDLLGPRLFQLRLLLVLGVNKTDNWIPPRSQWVQDRALLILKTMVCFSSESSVRINMRERWPSLQFLAILITVNVDRLVGGLQFEDPSLVGFVRAVVLKCLVGLKSFWFDQVGLTRMMDMELLRSDENTRVLDRLPSIALLVKSNPPGDRQIISLMPVLLSILAPPNIQWTSDLMLRMEGRCLSKMTHPLFENNDPILVEAALVLNQLAQFVECQQFLMSKPGAIWILGRMMVERTLVGTPALKENLEKDQDGNMDENDDGAGPEDETHQAAVDTSTAVIGAAATLANEETIPRLLLEKVLFDTLTRVFSAVDMAKTLVSNNTATELFAAILETDQPLCFYSSRLDLEVNSGSVQTPPNDDDSEQDPVQILPVPRQHALHQQLLGHFREVLTRSRKRFDNIFKYVGGHRSLRQDADDSEDTMYWLREFGALVFLYLSSPEEVTAALSKMDKTALLNSESVFGVVCRMLTLEVHYEDDPEEKSPTQDTSQDIIMEEGTETVKREEAVLRRFSAGLAIQSLCWRHAEKWRQQHLTLMQSYDSVLTTEWETHMAALKGADTKGVVFSTSQPPSPPRLANFLVQGRVIIFQNRALLARASAYFEALLQSEFKETSMDQIPLGDVDPDDFELLLDVIRESEMTALHLLPEDLPFTVVLRLMVCADRFLVGFVKRLAEKWILSTLGKKELKYYRAKKSLSQEVQSQESKEVALGSKRGRESSPAPPSKRTKIDHNPGSLGFSSSDQDVEKAKGTETGEEETLQDCLLMIYEMCSHPRLGDFRFREHPFHGLLWDALKRMALRLQTVAITPRFATLMDQGEDKIQEFLQILHELVENSIP
ncbi:hypothetical protein EMPS_08230 [Entomortierella parvispora]|uniref:BTB domain-containing protein n=1 Tax=Entomortierella parvispora TaxID=205924 RepID=A0A9P3HGI0_9FUNG|nr:hypothetical protein EMPS_08230 [Entomortierella parvispora]